ncbi:MAG: PIN domain-containing protein [Verrucomicrobia bacterium]|jgi:predicted nucleic acid-binding protein|nr:PIN domain-containing protein [Verrucomicrobiota bacterium]
MRRLLLDTNALIALSDPNHRVFKLVEAELRSGGEASTCSVAWHEYVRGPLLKQDRARALRVIESRIMDLGRRNAETAAELYNSTGRRRGSTADCLIASVAIDSNAEMVTCNLADFALFVPHGLRLADIP